jgi:hypothetical protein
MVSIDFHRSNYDSCVYFKKLDGGDFVYLLLYVDDMLIASSNLKEVRRLKEQLSSAFEMKDLGAAKRILGMEITRDRSKRKLFLSQKSFAEKVLRRFGMEKAKVVSTPLAAHFKLSAALSPKSDAEKKYMEKVPYSSAVGSLMYLMVCTRPDIAQAVSVVSRYLSCPGKGHWEAVKWIFRYLRGTIDARLEFGNGKALTGYVDADFAGDLDKRRSLTGYVFTLGDCAISWKSTLQATVALSSTEAEYMAITEAIKEAIWLKAFVGEMSSFEGPITVFCDNQSAIHLTKDRMYHEKTKHIDIRYHFVRDVISEGKVAVKKIGTESNPADMLTKPLPIAKFKLCSSLVSVCF